MNLTDLQREIEALPRLIVAEEPAENGGTTTSLDIVARQGKLLLRLTAAVEALEGRYRGLSERLAVQDERIAVLTAENTALRREQERRSHEERERFRQFAGEIVPILDVLDWVVGVATLREGSLGDEVRRARRECLKRLAAIGITEIPAEGLPDGRLHESVDTVETDAVEQYHIVSVVRPGYQWGSEILRRAEIVTATPVGNISAE